VIREGTAIVPSPFSLIGVNTVHEHLLVKIKADNADNATSEVREIMNSSIDSSENEDGWDYIGGINQVTQKNLSTFSTTAKSLSELVKEFKQCIYQYKARHENSLKDLFFINMAEEYMPSEDVPLYLNKKNQYGDKIDTYIEKLGKRVSLNSILEKKLKSPDKKPSKTFSEYIDGFVDSLFSDSMIPYHIRQLEKIKRCIEYPKETHITLQCTDNHFADLGGTGKYTYYFWTDRHH